MQTFMNFYAAKIEFRLPILLMLESLSRHLQMNVPKLSISSDFESFKTCFVSILQIHQNFLNIT